MYLDSTSPLREFPFRRCIFKQIATFQFIDCVHLMLLFYACLILKSNKLTLPYFGILYLIQMSLISLVFYNISVISPLYRIWLQYLRFIQTILKLFFVLLQSRSQSFLYEDLSSFMTFSGSFKRFICFNIIILQPS